MEHFAATELFSLRTLTAFMSCLEHVFSLLPHFLCHHYFTLHQPHHITLSSHADLPVSRGRYEVQAAVDSVVWHGPAVHPRLCIQEVLTLTVNVVYDWLPTGNMEERHQAERKQEEIR